ncbi:hypothetical protein BDC45DRAFT_484829 [Circinella umbellata]|nr:hypothetical protein BDC45DRAFT_484829 [Circinella umbellata]
MSPADIIPSNNSNDKSKSTVTIDNNYENERQPLLPTTSINNNGINNRNVQSEVIGLLLMAICAFAFASMTLFVKLSGSSFPSFEIVFARSLIQTVLGLLACFYMGINPLGNRPIRPWLVFRGVIGGLALALNFYAVTHLPLADATVIMYLNPIFTTILAALVLSEPFYLFEGICVISSFTGALLVVKPEFMFGVLANNDVPSLEHDGQAKGERGFAVLVALAGAFLSAVAYCTIRKVGNAAHFLVLTIYFGVVGILISIPPLLTFQTFVQPKEWSEYCMLFMTGITAFIGQCLLSKGLQLAPAGPASMIRMLEVVLAFFFGIVIFQEYPDWLSILGSVIIVGTTTVLASRKWKSVNEARRRIMRR